MTKSAEIAGSAESTESAEHAELATARAHRAFHPNAHCVMVQISELGE
jgi:hypothetical protein